ncbi:MAG: nuclear transport factor 2 family protein [Chloroflexi bacterium]|nr:nuclear transport factor 2 family protein [Chloroflexota bacterium]
MAARASGLSAKDVATLRAGPKTFRQLLLKRDFASLVNTYARDAVVLPAGGKAVKGHAKIRSFMEAFPPITQFQLVIEEIDGRDDLAFVRGTYSMTMKLAGAKKAVKDTGKWLEIHRRRRDGSWPTAVDIFNSDLAPAP